LKYIHDAEGKRQNLVATLHPTFLEE